MNDFEMTSACNPFGLLACKIVQQAIMDYRALLRGQNFGEKTNLAEIRRFLRSQWCDDLLSFTEVDGAWVLSMLEREGKPTKEVERHSRMLTIDGQTKALHTWCRELGMDSKKIYRMYARQGERYTARHLAALRKERGL